MFRHSVYSSVLRASAPLTRPTTLDFGPLNRRGDALFIIFRLTGSAAPGTYTVEIFGSFDGVTYVLLGQDSNFTRVISSGDNGAHIFSLSGALSPRLRVVITPDGFPTGDVEVIARASVGVMDAGTGYKPQDYVPPHTHGFNDGVTDYALAFPLKSVVRGITVDPEAPVGFSDIPDMSITVTPPTAALNVRKWEATVRFSGLFSFGDGLATLEIRLERDGTPLSDTLRGATVLGGLFSLTTEDVRSHEAGVSHTYAAQWSASVAGITSVGTNRILTVELRPVA